MSVWVVSILSMLLALYASLAAARFERAEAHRQAVLAQGQRDILQEGVQFYQERGSWPTDLQDLAKADGFFHLRGYLARGDGGGLPAVAPPWSVHLSGTFDSAGLQDQRIAVVVRKRADYNQAQYLAASNNKCDGVQGLAFSAAAAWCPVSKSASAVSSASTEWAVGKERIALTQQYRLAEKLFRYRRATGAFPAVAVATSVATFATPTDIGAEVGTGPETCRGTFYWAGVPLECDNLYNVFGQPVQYRRINATQFELSSGGVIPNFGGAARTLRVTYTYS